MAYGNDCSLPGEWEQIENGSKLSIPKLTLTAETASGNVCNRVMMAI